MQRIKVVVSREALPRFIFYGFCLLFVQNAALVKLRDAENLSGGELRGIAKILPFFNGFCLLFVQNAALMKRDAGKKVVVSREALQRSCPFLNGFCLLFLQNAALMKLRDAGKKVVVSREALLRSLPFL